MEPIDVSSTNSESSDWNIDVYKAVNDILLRDSATSVPSSVLPPSFASLFGTSNAGEPCKCSSKNLKIQQETLKSIQEALKQNNMIEALKFIQTPIPDGLSKKDKEKAREKLWHKYGDEFGDDDDED